MWAKSGAPRSGEAARVLRHVAGAKSRQALAGCDAGRDEFDIGHHGLHLRGVRRRGRPFMLRVMQELMRSSMLISVPVRALYCGKSS